VNLTAKGDYDAAFAILEEGLALAEKVGDANYTPRTLNTLGSLYMECGALDRAWDLDRVAAEQAHKRGDHEMIANAELNLGDIALQRGDLVAGGTAHVERGATLAAKAHRGRILVLAPRTLHSRLQSDRRSRVGRLE
jgi:tetratricopeptide (TPR) repeat protein